MDRKYAQYLLRKTKEDYNKIAERFSRARKIVWDEFRFLLNDYVIPGDRILDLGCGNGRFFEIVKNKNVDYIGADISERLIKIAKEKYPKAKFQVASALNLPFPNNYFDKVYSIATLHHIPSREFRAQFLEETKRVLKPEGLLVLTCWNLWQKSSHRKMIYRFILLKLLGFTKLDFKDILMPWQGTDKCYFHCFTKKELERLVEAVGFKIKDIGEIVVSREKRPNSNFYIIAEKQQGAAMPP